MIVPQMDSNGFFIVLSLMVPGGLETSADSNKVSCAEPSSGPTPKISSRDARQFRVVGRNPTLKCGEGLRTVLPSDDKLVELLFSAALGSLGN